MLNLSFSKLKGVFPGRVTRKQPEEGADDAQNGSSRSSEQHPSSQQGLPDGLATPGRLHASSPATSAPASAEGPASPAYVPARWTKFQQILSAPVINLSKLQEAAWTGVPDHLKPVCWRLLLRYEPPNRERAQSTVRRKRREYQSLVPAYYDISNKDRSDDDIADLKQVTVDVPRTAPEVPFFQHEVMQTALRRLLYIWGIRHPASGYVQGINDLVTPFLAVFLSEYLAGDISTWDCAQLTEQQLLDAEADSYWCLCKLVERVQDVYTSGQPGIQRCLFQLEELVARVDSGLAAHFKEEGISYFQFAFRWINCMLIRELPFLVAIRLWDTYLAEGMRFSEFLPYACAAFLLNWSKELQKMDFQDMLLFLQRLPTQAWTNKDLEVILSHAHMLKTSCDESHLVHVN